MNPHIDVVFTYCDGSDPIFAAKKKHFQGENDSDNPSIRFDTIYEIKYSVASVLKFMPWVRTIFIVTDEQMPPLLSFHPKIKLVQHKDIIPAELLPVYFSDVIESFLHKIPGLSDIFIYNNDDCFHMDYIQPEDLFNSQTNQIRIVNHFDLERIKQKTSEYSQRIVYTASLLKDQPQCINNHLSKILRKSTLTLLETLYAQELQKLRQHRFRTKDVIQYMFLALNVDHQLYKNELIPYGDTSIEYHFGSSDYTDALIARFVLNRRYKFACYNSMNFSFASVFDSFMKSVLA
jgi:hypothetical protein